MENLRMCKDPAPYQGNSAVQEMLAPLKKRPEEEMQCLEMTTKRKIIGRLVPCRCFRGEEEIISVLDYSHCSLQQVPKEVFSFERTLEELYLDANQIEELPKQLFGCQALKKLSIPDNDLSNLPATISSLVNLKELDISKNGIQEFPDNIKCCKCLTIVEASVNPISKLPDGFTQLLNLTQLYLNDAFLEFLPANFGRLNKLRILELRENHLKTLPKSMSKMSQLERLDLGNNDFSELPEGLELIQNLKELWIDNNSLQKLPGSIGKLKQLIYLDMSKNRIEAIEMEVSGCESLEDLLLSSNLLQHLPDSIGHLKKLTTLKIDDNQLVALPNTIGNLSLLEEFDCSCNELESLPPTIGYLHSLRTMAVDENFLTELPREIGNCKNVTVMSLRSNKLEFLPEEIGQMTKLRVLNLSDNRLKNLPFSFTKLKELAALWLSDNQSKALIPLQTEAHPETKQRVLTNYMFPQQPRGDEDFQSDSDSFNPTLWEEQRQQRMTVAFEFEEKKEEEEGPGKVKVEINLKRYPTPYPEDLKNMVKSVQNMVGKSHSSSLENSIPPPTPVTEQNLKDKYEHKWPISAKEVKSEVSTREHKDFQKSQIPDPSNHRSYSLDVPKRKEKEEHQERSEEPFGHRPTEMRMAELRPSLIDAPLYPPKLVLLGKDKKESTDDSEMDKHHHNSVSSGTYSDYSPSQASSGSSNARVKVQISAKEAVNSSLWGNRLTQSFPQQIETKPLLSQRESAPIGNMQQRNERQNLNDSFTENWNNSSHYDNTGFVAEENAVDTSGGNPMLNAKSRSTSAHGRRPLIRQDRIIGIPLELEQPAQRTSQEADVSPSNPWQNWTRTPSPFEDRTAFPSKLESTPVNSPLPDRKEHKPQSLENPSSFSSTPPWEFHDTPSSRNMGNVFSHGHCRPESAKNTISVSKSTERLSPLMKDLKTGRFKKSQSIDEIDIGALKVYNIPLHNYDPRNLIPGSHVRPDLGMMQEHSMSRSQSVPMLDDELFGYGTSRGQQQKPVAKKVYQFDQSFNPQGAVEVKPEKRVPPPFSYNPDYTSQQAKSLAKDLISPRAYRGYPPMEQMFSFSQPSVSEDSIPPQYTSQSSRPEFIKRADSLASATEMAMYRRVSEPHELPQTDRYGRPPFLGAIERQSSMSVAEAQFHKRNGRYDDDHTSYTDMKPQGGGYQVKTLTQRRPLSARSYSTETYGTAQTRPVSARPTMAALLEKLPSDYNLVNYGDKSSDDMKVRQNPGKVDESCNKMPPDWRQQLLRHIEARRLDRTPSQQSNILDNGQEDLSLSQWNPYPLGRRDVPPETVAKKPPDALPNGLHHPQAGSHIQTLMGSQSLQHRSREQPHYDGGMNKVTIQQYQSPLPIQIPAAQRGPQSGRCLIQTKGQRSMDGYPEQYCVRIEKNPGLGFSISGGLSGQGNPFKPSDKGIFITRVQPDGPAYGILRPGDKILQANGHSFVNMEHEKAVALLKSFQTTVDLVIQRELAV
ncbi:leucine-rich repeat-containing protein 7 isoform X8 [Hyperolius riggenbachi]|uniref:leucine-rich repeat-containing protein 7 isoform X8 n=1 Tax=Hyperolius riggenbachi TaxID=752182 RepID=UPI0035A29086